MNEIKIEMDKIKKAFMEHLYKSAQEDILKLLVVLERQIIHDCRPSMLEHRILMVVAKLALLNRSVHVGVKIGDLAKIIGRQKGTDRIDKTINHLISRGVLVQRGKGFDFPLVAPFLAMLGFVGGFGKKKKKGGGASGEEGKTPVKETQSQEPGAQELGLDETAIEAAIARGED